MMYVLTEKGYKGGWGKPIGIFDNKIDLKKYILFNFKKRYSDAKQIKIDSIDKHDKVELRIEASSKYGGYKFSGGYELYFFQKLNFGIEAETDFFDE